MWKFTLLLLAVPLYADVMTFNDTGNYFVGKASTTVVVPTNSFNFDLAPPQGAHITSVLLEVQDAYGSFNTLLDPITDRFVRGPLFDYTLSTTGWSQRFLGGGTDGTDPLWDGFSLNAAAVDVLNSMVGGHLHITGTLAIPANAAEYFMFDGSNKARLTLQYDGAATARARVSSLQFDPVPEPAAWLLTAPLVLVALRKRKRLV